MFKLLRNLKSSILYVVIIVLLLCVQAWADLTLPDYTSKIVNTGIQAGGIENPSPEVIRKSQMDNLLLFTKEDESILNKYTLISKHKIVALPTKKPNKNISTFFIKALLKSI